MQKLARKKAFSLVELAIVLIIIGLLIVAALQATSMIRSFKILGARSQTKSSAVNGIQGIVAWYDTTAEKSFLKKETVDGRKISTWNDINSHATIGSTGIQTDPNSKPVYIFDNVGANGLPTLRFDGNDYFDLPDGTIPYSNFDYTFFFVMKVTSTSISQGVLGSGDYETENGSNLINYKAGGFIENSWQKTDPLTSNLGVVAGKFQIFTFRYDNTEGRKIYINSVLKGEDNSTNRAGLPTNNSIGKSFLFGIPVQYMNGDIAEIILFGRAVTPEERMSVERYLSKKWTITFWIWAF